MIRISLVAVCFTVGAIGFSGCGKHAPVMGPPPAPRVTVSKPVARTVTSSFEFPGQTAAVGEVEMRARVTGYLMKVNFRMART